MSFQGAESASECEQAGESEEQDKEPWQQYFSKLFPKLFTRTRKTRNYKVQAKFIKKLVMVQKKAAECR